MAGFIYNNAQNRNIDHILSKLNSEFYFFISLEKKMNLYLRF